MKNYIEFKIEQFPLFRIWNRRPTFRILEKRLVFKGGHLEILFASQYRF